MSQPDNEERILVTRRGRVVVWTINREARRNAFDRATVRRLGQLCREAATDPDIGAVVITGAGQKAFCAGADLKERKGLSIDETRATLDLYRTELSFLDKLPKPVVAAINGIALGGGLEMALCCDFRVMASHARVGLTEVGLAIIPGAGGTQRLTRLVGEAAAKELILFAKRIDAGEALRRGVVHRVAAEGEDVVDAAVAFIEPVAGAAPVAVAAALDAIDAASELPLDAGLAHERRCYERTLATEDRVEALQAFAEKRAPVFKGR